MFDGVTGRGVNPSNCHIAAYPIKVEGDDIYVDTDNELS
jgi:toluene monooxygenase system ferredoxin subunit